MTNTQSNMRWGEDGPVSLFTYVHFIVGMIARLIGIPIGAWLIMNMIFESFESTCFSINFFNSLQFGKKSALYQAKSAAKGEPQFPVYEGDSPINSLCDIAACTVGWFVANWLIDLYQDWKMDNENSSP